MDGCEEKKILVVEDDKHLNKMMAYLFSAKGYSVEIALSGLEALEILKTFTPHLIVLDILMPRMNGFEFMNKIQEDLPLNNVPVIILSALPSHMNKDKAFAMGAIDYINKPFRSAELMIRIEEVIKENNEN